MNVWLPSVSHLHVVPEYTVCVSCPPSFFWLRSVRVAGALLVRTFTLPEELDQLHFIVWCREDKSQCTVLLLLRGRNTLAFTSASVTIEYFFARLSGRSPRLLEHSEVPACNWN
ncbi:hypothetical protein P3T76_011103 [Phytophthora citrophthora]|uniref:Uncharacterized protein n=1 Tax=Phytophthora citrophthora TaxID=4793 RepID=A0AAD9LGJ2_9STRA|nr:hypothetical protein P3T76_011103 [Phytophthora citrophthora]